LNRLAGNRHAVIGTKEGTLDLIDVGSGELVTSVEAHKGAIWAVTPLPDNSGLVSGSADKEAKFWEWEVPPPPTCCIEL
jgi:U3 small nucleolar RNA-associated protein 12